jgi:hypothetical protein
MHGGGVSVPWLVLLKVRRAVAGLAWFNRNK